MAGPRYGLYRTKDRTGRYHPKWRIRYRGADGRYLNATGFPDKRETARLAAQLAMEADEIRHGIRKPRTVADVASLRPIQTSLDEFLMWGKGQGGRGGRPWSPVHARNREFHLGVLRDRMGLRTLGDITLQGAEKALRTLQDEGRQLKAELASREMAPRRAVPNDVRAKKAA